MSRYLANYVLNKLMNYEFRPSGQAYEYSVEFSDGKES